MSQKEQDPAPEHSHRSHRSTFASRFQASEDQVAVLPHAKLARAPGPPLLAMWSTDQRSTKSSMMFRSTKECCKLLHKDIS